MKYHEQLKHPNWQKKRLEIMQRDEFKCQYCKNENNQLNVHHIYYDYKLLLWEYDDETLITLCFECHPEIHEMNKIITLIAKEFIINKIDLIDLYTYINNKNNKIMGKNNNWLIQAWYKQEIRELTKRGYDNEYFKQEQNRIKKEFEEQYDIEIDDFDIGYRCKEF